MINYVFNIRCTLDMKDNVYVIYSCIYNIYYIIARKALGNKGEQFAAWIGAHLQIHGATKSTLCDGGLPWCEQYETICKELFLQGMKHFPITPTIQLKMLCFETDYCALLS